MNQTALFLTVALMGTLALFALAMLAVRVAAFPPKGTSPTIAQRIELYAGAVAMLVALGQAWILHPGIPSAPRHEGVRIASIR